ncbi:hypothetical protein CW751_12135 [Brumimicrobium salinarum]|uniref:Outer membrane protein beta-barrel domain-containing protein n=1 Tax=Brumimicrobium salinarum TaxID=2058658 RepID=A0A2I0R051_9FLAO|nr:hypothetical protein [Brumimicrobium salinarum]PKR79971.1 hypothetical protein CW751_12135 [Brumimicrobium salinarum]
MLLKKPFRIIVCVLILTQLIENANHLKAQPIVTNPLSGSYFQPKFGINAATFFNHEDFLLDFGIGLEELGYDFSATFNGSFRPYYKTVFIEQSQNLYWQIEEKVVQFSLDLEKRFYFLEFMNRNKFGLYAHLKVGFFYGTYKGLSENRNQHFGITPSGGLSWQFASNARISAGYLYFNQNPYANPHTFNLKLSLYFGSEDTQ